MLQIQQLRLTPGHSKEDLEKKIRKELHLPDLTEIQYSIRKMSVDAHKRPSIYLVYTVEVTVPDEKKVFRKCRNNRKISLSVQKRYQDLHPAFFRQSTFKMSETMIREKKDRPVIIGSGPAGLFCAYLLSLAGLCPIVTERGAPVEERISDVHAFWEGGKLDPESNIQFGEGGAGTFSDGKLNSAIKDPEGRVRFVLETFAGFGADPSICYSYKPHVGTDVLTEVVRKMREEIIRLGGEFRFHTCLNGIGKTVKTDSRWKLSYANGETIYASRVVLAIGHSARDTFSMLYAAGFSMTPKSFAVGLRVQHPQKWIDDAMYGEECPYELGAAPYKLTYKAASGRGVYSFCMCPGGYVVNASSEPGMLAVNGMSYHDRAGENANSAIVVTVSPEDCRKETGKNRTPEPDPANAVFAGIAFQRNLERAAFRSGRGAVPVQRFDDYQKGIPTKEFGKVQPQIKGTFRPADVRKILPDVIAADLEEGMLAFGEKIPKFSDPDVLLCGVESRTSSPVRIVRDEEMEAVGFPGIYPCGEGAGYAGGITSAAVDGIKAAERILCKAALNISCRKEPHEISR